LLIWAYFKLKICKKIGKISAIRFKVKVIILYFAKAKVAIYFLQISCLRIISDFLANLAINFIRNACPVKSTSLNIEAIQRITIG
jgi:hypothetical protein